MKIGEIGNWGRWKWGKLPIGEIGKLEIGVQLNIWEMGEIEKFGKLEMGEFENWGN